MTTFNDSDDTLRNLIATSGVLPNVSNDIEAALADATTKNALSDEQDSRMLGKVHRLIAASTEDRFSSERPVSTGRSESPAARHLQATH